MKKVKNVFFFQAAKTEYHTFSSLVRVLVKYCTSELDKARAIFRYLPFSSTTNYKSRTKDTSCDLLDPISKPPVLSTSSS